MLSKAVKALFAISLLFLTLLAAVITVFINSFEINDYKDDIVKLVEVKTGRDFTINGEIRLGYSLVPSVVIEDASLGNPDWGSDQPMARIKSLEVEIALLPLLSDRISVKRLVLHSPRITLETDGKAQYNWNLAAFQKKAAAPVQQENKSDPASLPVVLNVSEIAISDGKLTYSDLSDKTAGYQLAIDEFDAYATSVAEPLSIYLRGSLNEQPLTMVGTVGALSALSDDKPYPVELRSRFADAAIDITGSLQQPLQLRGLSVAVSAELQSFDSLNHFLEHPLPDVGSVSFTATLIEQKDAVAIKNLKAEIAELTLTGSGKVGALARIHDVDMNIRAEAKSLLPLSRGLKLGGLKLPGPFMMTASLKSQGNVLLFSGMNLEMDKSDLSGDVRVGLGSQRPAVQATLTSKQLDVTEFLPSKKLKLGKQKVFSSEPLPFDALRQLDARIKLRANRLYTSSGQMENLNLDLQLKGGHLKTNTLRSNYAGGEMKGDILVDATVRGKTRVTADLDIKRLMPEKLPNLKGEISGARTDVSIKSTTKGQSVAELMANMNGQLLVDVGKGNIKSERFNILDSEIISSALNTLLPMPADKSGRKLICAVVKFDIYDGVAMTDDGIAISTDRMDVVGSGVVDLRQEMLNIGIKPRAKDGIGIGAGSLADLVKLGGPLAEPRIEADTLDAFKSGLSIGAAVFTGGISFLAEGLYGFATADRDPCSTARASESKKRSSLKANAKSTRLSQNQDALSDRILNGFQ